MSIKLFRSLNRILLTGWGIVVQGRSASRCEVGDPVDVLIWRAPSTAVVGLAIRRGGKEMDLWTQEGLGGLLGVLGAWFARFLETDSGSQIDPNG